jgi:serine/threonine-protein kinase
MSGLEPDSSARVGSTLRGKWTLERLLGEGGMASVFVARHKIGRVDAIKILHPAIAATPQLRARFEQEAHVVNRFRHPGAVEIRDIDVTEDGAPFLVMEFLEGETLSAVARRTNGPLELAAVLRMADQVLDVLAAAHAQGIIHRDIKPDNLLLLKDGRIKVLDFGIARFRDSVNARLKTSTGTTLGTVSYMPPEQAKGVDIDARVDLYAVGATAFRLLAGRRVHEADTEVERLMKVVSEPAPPLATVAPAVPVDACAVIDKALAFDRDHRYPDAGTMQTDVRALLRGEAPSQRKASGAPAPPASAPPASGRIDAPTRAEALRPVAPEAVPTTALPSPQRPPPSAHDVPTRAVPGYAHDVATVAAQPPSLSPASAPTAATRLAVPGVVAAPAPSTRGAPGSPAPTAVTTPPARRSMSRNEALAAIAVGSFLLLALLGGAVWMLTSRGSEVATQGDPPASTDSSSAHPASPSAPGPLGAPGPPATPGPATAIAPPQPIPGHGRAHHK